MLKTPVITTNRFLKTGLIISLGLVLCFKDVFAQARLLGRILDDNGKPVVAAIVSITGNGRTGAVISNNQGYYTFLDLPEGEYNIKALKSGQSSRKKLVMLKDNNTLMFNLKIQSEEFKQPTVEPPLIASAPPKKEIRRTVEKAKKRKPKPKPRKPVQKEKTPEVIPQEPVIVAEATNKPDVREDTLIAQTVTLAENLQNEAIKKSLIEAETTEGYSKIVFEKGISIEGGVEKIYNYLEYPLSAKNVSKSVYVIAQVYVDKQGNLRRIDMIKKGPEIFNEEVYRVLTEKITFEPAEFDSEPIAGTMTVVVNFSPNN